MARPETPTRGKGSKLPPKASPAVSPASASETWSSSQGLPGGQAHAIEELATDSAHALAALKRLPDGDAFWMHIAELKRWEQNPRENDDASIKVAASIEKFGFVAPIIIDRAMDRMVAGDTRVKGVRLLLGKDPSFVARGAPGPGYVRVVFHNFADEAEANLYAIADNRLNELADWDSKKREEILAHYDEHDRMIAGYAPEVVKADALEVRCVDVEALAQETFWLTVRGPLPTQPDVLDKLRVSLSEIPGVEVQVGAG